MQVEIAVVDNKRRIRNSNFGNKPDISTLALFTTDSLISLAQSIDTNLKSGNRFDTSHIFNAGVWREASLLQTQETQNSARGKI